MQQQSQSRRLLGIYTVMVLVVLLVVVVEWRLNDQPTTASVPPPASTNAQRNPGRVDTQTVLAGQQLYRSYCATCHGTSGRGDGPAASQFSTPPDLIAAMQAGGTTDGAVYNAIANSAPTSTHPAFDKQLSEQQIWQLVAYLRTFKPLVAAAPIPTFSASAPAAAAPSPPGAATPSSAPATDLSVKLPSLVPDMREPLPPVVFARNGNIWRSDGTDAPPKQLTLFTDQQYAGQPVYHASSDHIAFITVSPPPITATIPTPVGELFVMKPDGSDLRPVWQSALGMLSLPSWTPDGAAIYVMYNGEQNAPTTGDETWRPQIVRVDVASGERQVVVEAALDPALSSDGTQLAYLRIEDDSTMWLMLAKPDGTAARPVLETRAFSGLFAPRFAPDGTQIIFAAVDGPETDDEGYPITNSRSSTTGALLGWFAPATAEAHGAPWDIWIVNVDGSGLRRLTFFYEDLPMAVFSPDGAEVVIMGYGGFYRMRRDGSHLRRINQDGDHGGLDWVP